MRLCVRAVPVICLWSLLTRVMADEIFHTNDRRDVDEYDNVCTKETFQEVVTGLPFYYFDGLSRLQPRKVGEERSMWIGEKKYTVITRAVQPPIFGLYVRSTAKVIYGREKLRKKEKPEVLNYLSDTECNTLIEMALNEGLFKSKTVDDLENPEESQKAANNSDIARVSQQAWIDVNSHPDGILHELKERLFFLTGLPWKIISDSEAMQVARYTPGGHYHAHLDSTEYNSEKYTEEEFYRMFCCHHAENDAPCRLCRYMTVMYYLSEVEHGGETAFVTAKLHPDQKDRTEYADNLSLNCSDANLLIKPRKGSAIVWYNHHIDPQTGWLGEGDTYSLHGGCDVIKGVKWIGNNWINVPPYESRYLNSIYNPWTK